MATRAKTSIRHTAVHTAGLIALAAGVLGFSSAASATTNITGGNVSGTWSFSGSPYVISGDITVPNSTTLTIENGVDVQFKGSDGTHSGLDASRIEFTVNGKLVVSGFSNSPVTFEMQIGSPGNWYGIVVNSQAFGVNITGLVLQDAYQNGIRNWMTSAPLTITESTIKNISMDGVDLLAGSLAMDGLYIEAFGGAAVWIGGAAGDALTADIVNCIFVQSGWGLDIQSNAKVTATLTNSTIDSNARGVLILGADTGSSLAIKNTIITNNTDLGVEDDSGGNTAVTLTYSDVWTNGASTNSVAPGTGCIAADPHFFSSVDYDLVLSLIHI